MILHLSDPHFGTEEAQLVKALQQLCWRLKPELVVVSGDLTQRARHSQFARAKHFLESLDCPYLVIPGNHDIPLFHLLKRVWQPFDRYKQCFGSLAPTHETKHFYVVGLNTITSHHHTKGSISPKQIERVAQLLQAAPAHKYKIVVTHQPFMVKTQQDKGSEDIPRLVVPALRRWSYVGLNALLHGHLHESAVYDLNQHYDLGQLQPILDIHAGTALSARRRHQLPNSVNIICNDLSVHRYDFNDFTQQFAFEKILWQGALSSDAEDGKNKK